MSSPPPPKPAARNASLRPWYLVCAMVVTWFLGVQGLTSGIHTADFLRHSTVSTAHADGDDSPAPAEQILEAHENARLAALSEMREVAFPLAVGRAVLGGLLVVASGLAMGGRRGARSLALQAIAANMAFGIAEYALTRQVRTASIEAVAAVTSAMEPAADFAGIGWWLERARLTFQLVPLGLGAVALTRERTKTFFAAVARAIERAEEEP